jgi:carboxypeptidase C (cathepsin A)
MNRIFELVSSCAIISFLALPLIGQQASSTSSPSSRQRPPAATQKPAQEPEKPVETPPTVTKPSEQQSHETKEEEPPVRGLEPNLVDASPVATQHEVRINGKALRYTATAGRLPIRDDAGALQAEMFFVAYTSDAGTPANQRPLTFAFNGGPGSASLWLHMGALGPRRVVMQPEGWMPASPYRMTDNAYTILDKTDLVMVDAIGTGFSRARTEKALKHYLSVKGDIEAFGEFIRLYITRNERWSSPLYLLGESYGTTRSAGLSGYLIQRGIAFNGIMLLSTAIDLGTLESPHGNDLPYILILPTYAMAAAYHHKLAPELAQDLAKLRTEVELWASTTYAQALAKGDNIPAEERQAAIDQMARYTGLSKQVIDDADLRVDVPKFTHNLLLDQKLRIGRLDSRFTGPDPEGVLDTPFFDPSGSQPEPPFTSTFNAYVRTELGYKTDMPYYTSGGEGFFKKWDWGNAIEGIPSTAMDLRSAMTRDPFLKVLVMEGYYDLATPFFAADYTYDHLQLPANLRKNLSVAHYDSGHMVYLRQESLVQFKNDVGNFIDSTLGAAR